MLPQLVYYILEDVDEYFEEKLLLFEVGGGGGGGVKITLCLKLVLIMLEIILLVPRPS